MQGFYIIVGVLVALIAIQTNTVFGQSNKPQSLSTLECVPYSAPNLIVVKIIYTAEATSDCLDELDKQIASFHPTGITVSTLESVGGGSATTPPGEVHRSDIIYLIK